MTVHSYSISAGAFIASRVAAHCQSDVRISFPFETASFCFLDAARCLIMVTLIFMASPNNNVASPNHNKAPPNINVALPKYNVASPKINVAPPKHNKASPKINVAPPNHNKTPSNIIMMTPKIIIATPTPK